jgi:NAD(P)-dependent dehydrogenase (short-subunit alcohol dehydrogenase family)
MSIRPDYFKLSGKTVLITGASSGLGAHFAHVLAAEGAHVVLAARREAMLHDEAESIRWASGQATTLALDVCDAGSVTQALARLRELDLVPDILVNNAGVASGPKAFLDTTEEDWRWVVDTNLNGAWRVARETTRLWVELKRPGVVVNVASVYGLRTGLWKVAYNVSKAGVVQLTRTMAIELARYGIRVNALCPGWFGSAINDDYFATEAGMKYINTFPMKRLGRLEELSAPLLLLAGEAGSYINGAALAVDGGLGAAAV